MAKDQAINVATINRLLPAGYSARLATSDDPSTDNSVEILLHGAPTRWELQVGAGYVGVNEYGFEAGKLEWMQDHGIYRSATKAVAKLLMLLWQPRMPVNGARRVLDEIVKGRE